MSRPTPPSYKAKNWPTYNDGLKKRGSLTICFDPEMVWDHCRPASEAGNETIATLRSRPA